MPPFAEIRDEHYLPAFEEGMAEHLQEVQNITRRRDMPTFENTMVPLEEAGQLLTRVANVFCNKASADSNEVTRDLEEELAPAPRCAPGRDQARLRSSTGASRPSTSSSDQLDLDPESRYLVERYYVEMTVAGAGLDETEKEQL